MLVANKRVQLSKDIANEDGGIETCEYGIYSDFKEYTPDEFVKSLDIKDTSTSRERFYHFWMSGDTETCGVYYLPTDTKYTAPYKNIPNNLIPEKDFPKPTYVYCWQLSVNGLICYGRHIREFVDLLNLISKKFEHEYNKPTKDGKHYYKLIKLFFYNLGYDYTFFREYFPNAEIVLGDKYNPVKVNLTNTIELVDASALVTGLSLKNALKDYNIHIPKDGIDHTIHRTPDTILSAEEIGYAADDVYYLDKFIANKLKIDNEFYKNVGQLPYTKTMEVKHFIKNYDGEKYMKTTIDVYKQYYKNIEDVSDYYDLYTDIEYIPEFKNKTIFFDGYLIYFRKNKPYRYTKWMISKYILQKRVGSTYGDAESFKEEYEMLRKAYCGGFTHANMNYLGSVVNQPVECDDLTSDYTSEMSTQKYVYSYDQKINDYIDKETILNNSDKYGYLFKAKIKNLRPKHSYGLISKHKVDVAIGIKEDKDEKEFDSISIDNGRILRADYIEVYGVDIDLINWNNVYDWDSIEFENVRKGKKYYLHDLITDAIDYFYTKKCINKGKTSKMKKENKINDEYYYMLSVLQLSKGKLNSMYGCSCTDKLKYKKMVLDKLGLDPESETYKELEKEIEDKFYSEECKYNDTIFTYAMGVQVTAYARKRLLDVITQTPDELFLYADTDSIYFITNDKTKEIIKEYNIGMQNDIQNYIKRKNIEDLAKQWKEYDKLPSQYAFDGSCDIFCTLGAKRYIKIHKNGEDNYKYEVTVAGAPKKNSAKKMESMTLNEALNYFRNGMKLSEKESGKKTHKHVDTGRIFTINIDGCEIECSNWVVLYDAPFEMSYSQTVKTCMKECYGEELGLGYKVL